MYEVSGGSSGGVPGESRRHGYFGGGEPYEGVSNTFGTVLPDPDVVAAAAVVMQYQVQGQQGTSQ
jgi:hypothetical protein